MCGETKQNKNNPLFIYTPWQWQGKNVVNIPCSNKDNSVFMWNVLWGDGNLKFLVSFGELHTQRVRSCSWVTYVWILPYIRMYTSTDSISILSGISLDSIFLSGFPRPRSMLFFKPNNTQKHTLRFYRYCLRGNVKLFDQLLEVDYI